MAWSIKRNVGSTGDNPLAGPIFTAPSGPNACSVCFRKGGFMKRLNAGLIECSHVECPHRNKTTAQPAEKP